MYKNLIGVSCASITDIFRHIKDWIIKRNGIADYSSSGLGWTLHDSYFATDQDSPVTDDWIVVSSVGEDGKQSYFYRILFSTLANSILRTRGGLYWDAATNAWVVPQFTGDQSNGPTSGTVFTLWIYGSLDHLYIIIGNGTANYGRAVAPLVNTLYDATIAETTSAVSAGTDVVVPFDAVPESWAIGRAVFIRHNAGIEKTTITNISGLNVTMTLANSYASGAKASRDYCGLFMSSGANFADSGRVLIGHNGLVTDAAQTVLGAANTTITGAGDPDIANSDHVPVPMKIYNATIGAVYGSLLELYQISSTGITSGSVYLDPETGIEYRAFSIDSAMFLFKEV